MTERTRKSTRRGFLGKAVALAGGVPLASPLLWTAQRDRTRTEARVPAHKPAPGYRSLNEDEAAFTEAMVNVLCPADHLTPNGVNVGLAAFIDRELAGAFGERRQALAPLLLTQEKFYKSGIAAADTAAREQFGLRFEQLSTKKATGFLYDIAGGRASDPHFPLDKWLNELVDPLLIHASFTGPIYDGYCNRVFWKLTAYPPQPALA